MSGRAAILRLEVGEPEPALPGDGVILDQHPGQRRNRRLLAKELDVALERRIAQIEPAGFCCAAPATVSSVAIMPTAARRRGAVTGSV